MFPPYFVFDGIIITLKIVVVNRFSAKNENYFSDYSEIQIFVLHIYTYKNSSHIGSYLLYLVTLDTIDLISERSSNGSQAV